MKLRFRCVRKEHGSMVVEAAMILPIFLLFVIFLIYIVKMAFVTIALQMTVSDTVKQVAAHMYPVAIVMEKNEDSSGESQREDGKDSFGSETPKLTMEDLEQAYSQILPPPIGDWVKDSKLFRDAEDILYQSAGDALIKPIMKPFVQQGVLDYERIHVTRVLLPHMKKKDMPYLSLEISYTMPMKVPFLNRELVLQAKAAERIWIGDTFIAKDGDGTDQNGDKPVIESVQPNPLRPGSKGKIIAKTVPNKKAKVTVFYNSGTSTAKYLEEKTADSSGYLEWEWLVSGNTTKGSTVKIVIEAENGQKTDAYISVVQALP